LCISAAWSHGGPREEETDFEAGLQDFNTTTQDTEADDADDADDDL